MGDVAIEIHGHEHKKRGYERRVKFKFRQNISDQKLARAGSPVSSLASKPGTKEICQQIFWISIIVSYQDPQLRPEIN